MYITGWRRLRRGEVAPIQTTSHAVASLWELFYVLYKKCYKGRRIRWTDALTDWETKGRYSEGEPWDCVVAMVAGDDDDGDAQGIIEWVAQRWFY